MKPDAPAMSALARDIARTEAKIQDLDWQIKEIGQPAGHQLQRRLDALRIEQHALSRNLRDLIGYDHNDEATRLRKIETLLDYIRREEDSLQHDTDFLHQSGHTSSEFAAQAGLTLVHLCLHALKRIVGDHHPLGLSVFVNHTHQALAEQYGLKADSEKPG